MNKKTTAVKEETKPRSELLLEEILKSQSSIVDRLEKLENVTTNPITSQAESFMPAPTLERSLSEPSNLMAVPSEFRREVDAILNKNFEVEIEKHLDAPLLTFTIIVPEKYSLITPSQKEVMKRDIRPKVITIPGGVEEAKEWAEAVFKNLTPEIQAMVVSDRMKGL